MMAPQCEADDKAESVVSHQGSEASKNLFVIMSPERGAGGRWLPRKVEKTFVVIILWI